MTWDDILKRGRIGPNFYILCSIDRKFVNHSNLYIVLMKIMFGRTYKLHYTFMRIENLLLWNKV